MQERKDGERRVKKTGESEKKIRIGKRMENAR